MRHPALELQAAGFEIGLTDGGGVRVRPKSRLTDTTRQFIRTHKPELVDYLRRQAVNDTAASPTAPIVDWHRADRAYQAHHWTCPQCRAAGLGYGQGCAEGQALWDAYEAAPMPELGKVKRVTPAPQPTELPRAAPYRMTPRSDSDIVRMIGLHRRAIHAGLPDDQSTDKLLDALMDAPPDMGCCFACSHLRGSSPDRWQCAGRGHDLAGLPLAHAFVVQLHRCAGYAPPVACTKKTATTTTINHHAIGITP